MALRKQPLPLTFAGGVETQQDAKGVPPARLLDLQNATFVRKTSLAKRNGYRALSTLLDTSSASYTSPAGTSTPAVGLAARDTGELLVLTGDKAYSYRESSGRWSTTGDIASVLASDRPLARTGTVQAMPDTATANGIRVTAWEDNRGGVWSQVIEEATGRVLQGQAQLSATGFCPRVVVLDRTIQVLWLTGTGAVQMFSTIYTTAAPYAAPTVQMVTDDVYPTNPVFDATTCTLYLGGVYASGVVLAWATPAGYRVGYLSSYGTLGSSVTGLPGPVAMTSAVDLVTGPIAVANDTSSGTEVIVGWRDPSGYLRIRTHGIDLTSVTYSGAMYATPGITPYRLALSTTNNGTGYVWWAFEAAGATADQNYIVAGYLKSNGSSFATLAGTLRGHGLVARAFADQGSVYLAVAHGVKYYPYVAVVKLSGQTFGGAPGVTGGGTPTVARLLPGLSTGLPTRAHLASVQVSSRVATLPLGVRLQLSSANGDQFGEAGIRLQSLDFGHAGAYQSAQLGKGLYLAGAVPLRYDGDSWTEAGFHAAPDTASGTMTLTASSSGSMTSSATYLYRIAYEEIDANGELHPGPVSVSQTVTLTAGQTSVTLSIPTCRLTGKRRVRIGVFRTTANATGAPESIAFYRVTSTLPTDAGLTANGYLANNPTVDVVTFVDYLSDAQLITKEPLYTNGGIISNDPAPMAGGSLVSGKSRLFWTDPSDPHMVRYSQTLRDDTAMEESASLYLRCDPYGGPIVALAVMDDAVLVFKQTAIYVFVGPGPDADGGLSSNNAFTAPQLLTSDVGCKASGSVCQSPVGVVFQSSKGIMLVGRDRQVASIGDPVYAYNSQTVTRATLLPDRHQVLFLVSSGRTLLWDYQHGQWSTYTNHEGLDAAVVGGTYNYLRADGRVFCETVGSYADDNAHIPMRIDTAWIKAAGYLQGFQRIFHAEFLGTYKSAHQLSVSWRTDYQEAWTAPVLLSPDSLYTPSLYGAGTYGAGSYGGTIGPDTVYQQRIHINARCQAIAFRIEDVEATTTFGAAFELSELLLTAGVLGPAFPVGPARSA
jgi:hypothetical protein